MKAKELRERCVSVATWVDWENTMDLFMHGDPEVEVAAVAVTWLATNRVLKQAAELGCNFVISHEGAFYPQWVGTPSEDRHHSEKHALLDELGITLMRCHDTWDRMPEMGHTGCLAPPPPRCTSSERMSSWLPTMVPIRPLAASGPWTWMYPCSS